MNVNTNSKSKPWVVFLSGVWLFFCGAGSVWAQPKIEKAVLSNGASLYFVANSALPMLDVQIDFDAGSRRDPSAKVGLSSVTASMVDKGLLWKSDNKNSDKRMKGADTTALNGRSGKLNENQISDAWADIGANFDILAGEDRLTFRLRTLTDATLLNQASELAAQQMAHPTFDDKIWQRDRERMIAAWHEGQTQIGTVAPILFSRLIFDTQHLVSQNASQTKEAKNNASSFKDLAQLQIQSVSDVLKGANGSPSLHPYGYTVTPQTLQAISRQDMQDFYEAHVQACQAKVSMVGNLTLQQAIVLGEALLKPLSRVKSNSKITNFGNKNAKSTQLEAKEASCPQLPIIDEVNPLKNARYIGVPFDSAQAHVFMGQPGFKRKDADFFALTVGNHILGGGGFTSRLTTQVREKRGLSYSVYSYFSPGLHAGEFTIGLQTRTDQAFEAIDVAYQTLNEFVQKGPGEQELQAAKDNLVQGFALRFDSNKKLLENIANINWYDLPQDYLQTWTQKVQAVTVQDIRAAFGKTLNPQTMTTLIVGVKQ